jgi:hypothetical protein
VDCEKVKNGQLFAEMRQMGRRRCQKIKMSRGLWKRAKWAEDYEKIKMGRGLWKRVKWVEISQKCESEMKCPVSAILLKFAKTDAERRRDRPRRWGNDQEALRQSRGSGRRF